jgi:hypothetical protein
MCRAFICSARTQTPAHTRILSFTSKPNYHHRHCVQGIVNPAVLAGALPTHKVCTLLCLFSPCHHATGCSWDKYLSLFLCFILRSALISCGLYRPSGWDYETLEAYTTRSSSGPRHGSTSVFDFNQRHQSTILVTRLANAPHGVAARYLDNRHRLTSVPDFGQVLLLFPPPSQSSLTTSQSALSTDISQFSPPGTH